LKVVRPDSLKRIAAHRIACTVLQIAFAFSGTAMAGQDPDRAEAESRLGEVTLAISELRVQLDSSRSDHQQEQARMREVDLAIQAASLDFRILEEQRVRHLDELATLESQREIYLSSLEDRLGQLAEQVRSSYQMGNQSRIKLVLNQDDPARLGRMLAYYDFLNRAQVQKISSLKEALTTLEAMQKSIDQELSRVVSVQNEQRIVLEELSQQRRAREILLAQLSSQIDNEESRLGELEQNRKDLEALLERLSDVLADIPADLGSRTGVAGQQGKLPTPLKGPVKHAFGQQRAGGLRWQGWLIQSSTGAEASAVAYGRVAFADWLRGYGLMIIIDHGQGFLSLYGHNESLLHEVGAWVEPGEIISIVGSNPGSDQGLYFELRKDGKAVDPAAWIAR
jgi:septal ring factor EnvC (AmiA/AmiB activator)